MRLCKRSARLVEILLYIQYNQIEARFSKMDKYEEYNGN